MNNSLNLVVKVRLYPTVEQINEFKAISNAFKDICNFISQWYFDKHFKVNHKVFQKEMYQLIKKQYPEMNSLMVQSAFRCVDARYRAVKTQLKQQSYHYQDINTGKWYHERKD